MAIPVKFWVGFSKRPNSTARPGGEGYTIDCQITNTCSVLTPTIEITPIDGIEAYSHIYNASYAYVAAFNRYYYVSDITLVKSRVFWTLSVDAMGTYAGGIGGLSAYILRSSAYRDNDIIDIAYPTKPAIATSYTLASSPFNGNSFIVQYVGRYGMRSVMISESSFATLCNGLWQSIATLEGIDDLYAAMINPFQYIIGVQKTFADSGWSGTGGTGNIYLGAFDSGVSGTDMTNATGNISTTISVPKHPTATSEDLAFLKSSMYSSYSIFIPGCGWIPLVADDLYNATFLGVDFFFEANTGNMRADIKLDGGAVIASGSGKVSVNWGIGASSVDVIGTTANITGSVMSALTGNIAGAVAGVVNSVGGVVSTCQSAGGLSGCVGISEPIKLVLKYKDIGELDEDNIGHPVMQKLAIAGIPGYILCKNAYFGGAPTKTENDTINNYLNGGFYYE